MRAPLLALALLGCAERLPPDDCVPRFLGDASGALRPLAPMTAAVVVARRPVVRWTRRDIASDRCVRVDFCRDRDCRQPISHTDLVGDRAAPPDDLPPGVVFWRVRGEGAVSPTWYFYVPRGACSGVDGRSTELRSQFDVDGDGLGDLVRQDGVVHRQLPRTDPAAPTRFERWAEIDTSSARPVQSAGDVDGDGFLDIVAVHSGPNSDRNEAIVYRGPLPRGATAVSIRVGDAGFPRGGGLLGPGLRPVVHGDFNGDGYSDIAIGTDHTTSAPGVHLFAGGPDAVDALRLPRQTLCNVAISEGSHQPLAAHDLDGDGGDELVAGSHEANGGNGYAAVHRGRRSTGGDLVEALPHWDRYGLGGIRLGHSLAIADLDGDGLPELIIAAPHENFGCVHVHRVVSGAPTREPAFSRCGVPRTGSHHFGHTLDAADLDGDGHGDLALGGFGERLYAAVIRGTSTGLSDGIFYRDLPAGDRNDAWVHTAFVTATDHADVVVVTHAPGGVGPRVYPGIAGSVLPEP